LPELRECLILLLGADGKRRLELRQIGHRELFELYEGRLAFRRGGGRSDAVGFMPHPDLDTRRRVLETGLHGRPVNPETLARMT
jgi:hypothetical protein